MKTTSPIVMFALCASCAALFAEQKREQKFASLGNFRLENGQEIINLKLGYRTAGELNTAKSNAVLFPTWAGGTTKELA